MASIACKLGGTRHTHSSVAEVRACSASDPALDAELAMEREAEAEHQRNLAAWGPAPTTRPMSRREEDALEWRIERAQEAAEWAAEDRLDAQGF